jgi:hypothetical protein
MESFSLDLCLSFLIHSSLGDAARVVGGDANNAYLDRVSRCQCAQCHEYLS